MYSNNLWQIYSFLRIKNDYLSPLGNRILWTFKKKFYETWYYNYIGISKRGKKTRVQKWWQDFFEMPQGGHKMMQNATEIDRIKSSDEGF